MVRLEARESFIGQQLFTLRMFWELKKAIGFVRFLELLGSRPLVEFEEQVGL